MNKTKENIKSLLENTKQNLKSQLHKRVSGIYLYIICRFLFHTYKGEVLEKLEQNHYKALARLKHQSGRKFLSQFVSNTFVHHFQDWLSQSDKYKTENPIQIRGDGTKTGYHYGFLIPELRRLYDYVKHNYLKTHEIYVLLVSIGNRDYVVDFILVQKQKMKDLGLEKETGVNAMLIEMFKTLSDMVGPDLYNELKYHARISLDGAWGKEGMLTWFAHEQFRRVVTKSGGVGMIADGQEAYNLSDWKQSVIDQLPEEAWKPFHSSHKLHDVEYFEERLTFKKSKLTIHAVLLRFDSKDGKPYRYLALLSLSKQDWHAYQITQAYRGRWGVETMFRTTKQYMMLEKISFHTKRTKVKKSTKKTGSKKRKNETLNTPIERIEWMISFRFIGYMLIQWYRADYTHPSKISLKDAISDWEQYFQDLDSTSLQRLFSG